MVVVMVAGLSVVAVISPVIGAILPVPYWLLPKKLPFKALSFKSALATTFISLSLPLSSVAVKVTTALSPA